MADGYRDVPVFWLPPHKYEGCRKPDIVCRFPAHLLPKGNILPLADPFPSGSMLLDDRHRHVLSAPKMDVHTENGSSLQPHFYKIQNDRYPLYLYFLPCIFLTS